MLNNQTKAKKVNLFSCPTTLNLKVIKESIELRLNLNFFGFPTLTRQSNKQSIKLRLAHNVNRKPNSFIKKRKIPIIVLTM